MKALATLNDVKYIDFLTVEAVIGYNTECADVSNPRGAIYGCGASLMVEAPDGSRWQHDYRVRTSSEAESLKQLSALYEKIKACLLNGKKLNPLHWDSIQPRYGSDAYIAGNWENEVCRMERMSDDSDF